MVNDVAEQLGCGTNMVFCIIAKKAQICSSMYAFTTALHLGVFLRYKLIFSVILSHGYCVNRGANYITNTEYCDFILPIVVEAQVHVQGYQTQYKYVC